MVARDMPPTETPRAPRSRRTPHALFLAWRRALTRVVRSTSGVAGRAGGALSSAWRRVEPALSQAAQEAGDGIAAVPRDIGHAWRRAVSAVARVVAPARRWAAAKSLTLDAMRVWRRPAAWGELQPAAADRIAALGLRLFVAGIAASVGVGMWRAGSWRPAAGAAITTVAWAAARLLVMLALRPRGDRVRALTIAAWAASLAPFALGVTEGLRFAALAASAVWCAGALAASGLPARDARTMTAWAFGGQAGVTLGGLALRALLALVLG